MKPDISSLRKTVSRQWLFAVPGPPVFSTGTALGPDPRSLPYSLFACAPMKVGFPELMPFSSFFSDHTVPMPRTCPISCVMTSFKVPAASIAARSAVSNCIDPLAGRNAAAPAAAGRIAVGPACPRMPFTPSMSLPSARIRMSSITSPSTITDGKSPTMTVHQRSAADLNACFCESVKPPRNRTSIVYGDTESAALMWATSA